MSLTFGKYGPLRSAEEAYSDGFDTGLSWNSNWIPGGPWICKQGCTQDVAWKNYCNQTKLNNSEWLRGWSDGCKQAKEE